MIDAISHAIHAPTPSRSAEGSRIPNMGFFRVSLIERNMFRNPRNLGEVRHVGILSFAVVAGLIWLGVMMDQNQFNGEVEVSTSDPVT
jgi:hypothetical protein